MDSRFRKLKNTIHFVERKPAPALLPVMRSQKQGEILALLLGDPDLELSLTEIAKRTGAPSPSVFREIERAEKAGLLTTRRVGRTRLARADTASPYYAGLADRPAGDRRTTRAQLEGSLTRAVTPRAKLHRVPLPYNSLWAAHLNNRQGSRMCGLRTKIDAGADLG